MPLPEDYWASFEHRTTTLGEFVEAVRMISAYQARTRARFVWRGAADASWALHPSLARAYIDQHGAVPLERPLRAFERSVLDEAREWGLDWHASGGRLTALELLAALQHYAVPTRMLDFTFNPLIALWFAVENRDEVDGRVFAIDISNRLVTRDAAVLPDPWWWDVSPNVDTPWTTESWIWRPPPLEPRIVRQEGCFLMGGVPSTRPFRNVRETGAWRLLHASEVRQCMSVPFQLISYEQAVAAFEGRRLVGAPPEARAFTLRVSDKGTLRNELTQGFGYSPRSLFPDYPGLARYGDAWR
jgi:hypothetical protein